MGVGRSLGRLPGGRRDWDQHLIGHITTTAAAPFIYKTFENIR